MKASGNLLKMNTTPTKDVDYLLNVSDQQFLVNNWIGRQISLTYQHQINCIRCGRKTNKSFFQGYCYPCFISAPETDECILRPEKCQAQDGISRDMEWSKTHCLSDHYVYLAVSSGLKVGVTRNTQIPTRWIDQGASRAIKLVKTPNRYLAGLVEVDLKQHFADKTNWQQMLKNMVKREIDLREEKRAASQLLREDLQQYFLAGEEITNISYPVKQFPRKVKSLSFDKIDEYKGILMGIKGQYLIFEDGTVFNVRKHNGYLVEVEVN